MKLLDVADLRAPLLLLLGLAACSTPPRSPAERLAACGDEACREALIIEVFKESGVGPATQLLDQLPSPIERISVVIALTEAAPGQTGTLCDTLSDRHAQSRCRKLNRRPHLQVTPPVAVHDERQAEGPTDTQLRASGWTPEIDPVEVGDPCENEPDPTGCLTQLATRALGSGNVDEAHAVCESAEGDKWQDECRFVAAEQAVQRSDGGSYTESSELCATAGHYRARCQDHLITRLAQRGPKATDPPADWEAALERATEVAESWATRNQDYQEVLVDRYWALTLNASYQGAIGPGVPTRGLPEEALPHLHAEVSRLVVVAAKPEGASLPTLVSKARAALVRPVPGWVAPPSHTPILGTDYWRTDEPGQEGIVAVSWRGFSRRTTSAVVEEDLAICILEAAARQGEAWSDFIQAATLHETPAIAWTAQRLVAELAKAPSPTEAPKADGL